MEILLCMFNFFSKLNKTQNKKFFFIMPLIFVSLFFCVFFFFPGCAKNNFSKNNSSGKKASKNNLPVLKIATEYGYPPFEYLASDGKTLIGFDIDMAEEICRRIKMKPLFEDVQWAGIFSGLEAGRYDCVVSAVTITPERKEKFLITRPYVKNSQCFIVKAPMWFEESDEFIDSPEKLNGKKVAYQAETVSDVYVTNLLENGAKFEVFEYDKLMDAINDLKFERVDVVVAESVASNAIVKESGYTLQIDYIDEPDAEFGILVNKKNPELFEKIESALDSMYDDGFMKSLEKKWLN